MKRSVSASLSSAIVVTLGVVAVAGGACQGATEVTVDLSYTGNCDELRSVAIVVSGDAPSASDRIQKDIFTTTASTCNGGVIGSLVVTPPDSGNRGAIVVVAGIDRKPEQCDPSNQFFGCIVARRTFSFSPHRQLHLPIVLSLDCKNVPCDAISTCSHGTCVSSEALCEGDECGKTGTDPVDATTFVDGNLLDGDGNVIVDGAVDAPTDAPIGDALPDGPVSDGCTTHGQPVSCDPNPCQPNQACCSFACAPQGSGATCSISGNCPMFSVGCRGSENCPLGSICCTNLQTGTYCAAGNTCPSQQTQVCQNACECPSKNCGFSGSKYPRFVKVCDP